MKLFPSSVEAIEAHTASHQLRRTVLTLIFVLLSVAVHAFIFCLRNCEVERTRKAALGSGFLHLGGNHRLFFDGVAVSIAQQVCAEVFEVVQVGCTLRRKWQHNLFTWWGGDLLLKQV